MELDTGDDGHVVVVSQGARIRLDIWIEVGLITSAFASAALNPTEAHKIAAALVKAADEAEKP